MRFCHSFSWVLLKSRMNITLKSKNGNILHGLVLTYCFFLRGEWGIVIASITPLLVALTSKVSLQDPTTDLISFLYQDFKGYGLWHLLNQFHVSC